MPTTGGDVSGIHIDPMQLSALLGQKHPPTQQQAEVIAADLGPMLVVAGAGAGKTETMAARVVWLVANGLIEPDRVLGLTFTRKAAQQLSKRIRTRLEQLARIPELAELDPSGVLANRLKTIAPTVSTYDSFAGKLIGEFGLLLPVEPSSRMISQTELFRIADQVVANYGGELHTNHKQITVVETLLSLVSELDGHMVAPAELSEETEAFVHLFEQLPKAPRQRDNLNATMQKWHDTQRLRLEYLPLARILKEKLAEDNLMTFGEQMSLAARLAQNNPQVGAVLRNRFQVIMLDEYQDTSHAQRVLLSQLFAGAAVTAVGDPMQSIYGWRGATAANLERFVTDFAVGKTPAPKKELTISFRNPPAVLTLANAVSTTVLGAPHDPRRPVQPLTCLPSSDHGNVDFGFFATADEERSFVADQLAEAYDNRGEQPFTAAVLVRKRAHMAPMAQELQARGVPVEIVGLAGLLDVPEVADMVAVATMLSKPVDTGAALRVVAGPMVGLGVADILALAERVRNLAGRTAKKIEYSADPAEKLQQIIAETVPTTAESVVGFGDAIADLGEPERYSAQGYQRLRRLSSQLRVLRGSITAGASLPDLFADIEKVMGIRTEVLSREDPRGDGAAGVVHLDRLHAEVASFAAIPGATLNQLLDYFTIARDQELGLAPGEVQVKSDRVQLLTAHKAKGLEWQIVAVLHADSATYDARVSTWLTSVAAVPSTLRGDAAFEADSVGSPVLDTVSLENRKELEEAGKEHINDFKKGAAEENTRLFYVAITRSEQRLIVTASAQSDTGRLVKPYVNFDLIMQQAPECVVQWLDEKQQAELAEPEPITGFFPPAHIDFKLQEAAQLVRQAMVEDIDFNDEYELFGQWESDVTALIEEHQRLKSAVVEVELSRELTATDIVALTENPEWFAKRLRRPVPFKPNAYAKRGTEFHQWLENRFGVPTLLDETELPGMGEETPQVDLETLKEGFLASDFADRVPAYVEHPFEITVGGVVIRGRMDAVFKDDHGWHIVDWKTGEKPQPRQLRHLLMQLAVYRLAWARQQGIDPAEVRASFFYVRHNELVDAQVLPEETELAAMLDNVVNKD